MAIDKTWDKIIKIWVDWKCQTWNCRTWICKKWQIWYV